MRRAATALALALAAAASATTTHRTHRFLAHTTTTERSADASGVVAFF
mgnify:CR=1 FL=1